MRIGLEEEGAEDGCSNDEEDAGTKPACGSLRGVWVTRRELAVHLHAADESHDSAENRMAVLLCNIWPDAIEAPVLETDGCWLPVETLGVDACADGNRIRISRIESYGCAAVLLARAV